MKPTRPQISKGGSYPQEFFEDAVRYWLSSGQTLALVAADLGLSPECLRLWRKNMEVAQPESLIDAHSGSTELAQSCEIGQLRRELEAMIIHSMTCQRDILPSAISIFSDDKALSGGLK